jgi:hypothetical protein
MDTTDDQTPDKGAVLRGGLVGALIGLGLVLLAVFFLFNLDEGTDVLGVFIPLAVGLLSGALGTMALVPLWRGFGPPSGPTIAWFLRGLAALGVVLAGAGVLLGELPWIGFALAPLLVCALMLRESGRFARLAED